MLDDASRLNATPIARQADPHLARRQPAAARIARHAGRGRTEGRPIAFGGARHSMGGQSLPRNGIAASFAAPRSNPTQKARIYRVSAGARWRDVIRVLDPIGFSPAVTQSNHDFSIGGTLSVNAHGWPVPFGPFGSTVRRFRIMLADGSVVTCSAAENAELFRLAVGGYGLFGIVIDADLGDGGERPADAGVGVDESRRVCAAICGARQRSIAAHGVWPACRSRARDFCRALLDSLAQAPGARCPRRKTPRHFMLSRASFAPRSAPSAASAQGGSKPGCRGSPRSPATLAERAGRGLEGWRSLAAPTSCTNISCRRIAF
jgi:hypothetical protein